MGPPKGDIIRFGAFELDRTSGELRKHGIRIRLQEQPLRVLLMLLERRGDVISREELRERLWPSGTYVDFDHSLNAAIAKLRSALSDSSGAPRFIETVPRRGYRFIGSATLLDGSGSDSGVAPTSCDSTPVPPASPERRVFFRTFAAAAIWLVSLISLVLWLSLRRVEPSPAVMATPITTLKGSETAPAFSPDGKAVAFLWDRGESGSPHIWVKVLGSEIPRQFTSSLQSEHSPAWSPDGQTIAFLRALPGNRVQYLIKPYPDGTERVVATTGTCRPAPEYSRSVAWYPDGKHLIVSASTTGSDCGLVALSIAKGTVSKLTQSPPGQADISAAVSPDGRTLAFVRGAMYPSFALYAAALSSESMTIGQPWKVTPETDFAELAPAWLPDSDELVYARGNALSDMALFRIGARGHGRPQPIIGAGPMATSPSISKSGGLVFVAGPARSSSLWRVEFPTDAHTPPVLAEVAPSSYNQQSPAFSPDGTRVAFESERSGKREIWISDIKGTSIQQITHGGAGPQAPDWSPDGRRLAFSQVIGGQRDLYVVDAAGGVPLRLTSEPTDDAAPCWSRDGWIYFQSNRTGVYEVWRMAADGTAVSQLTRTGGTGPRASFDGSSIYYRKSGGLWKIGIDLGPEMPVFDNVNPLNNTALVENGILFVSSTPSVSKDGQLNSVLRFFESTTGLTKDRALIPGAVGWGLTASPDGSSVVLTRVKTGESDLRLIETRK